MFYLILFRKIIVTNRFVPNVLICVTRFEYGISVFLLWHENVRGSVCTQQGSFEILKSSSLIVTHSFLLEDTWSRLFCANRKYTSRSPIFVALILWTWFCQIFSSHIYEIRRKKFLGYCEQLSMAYYYRSKSYLKQELIWHIKAMTNFLKMLQRY